MKYLIILVVCALLVVAAFVYFGSGDLKVAPKKSSADLAASAARLDFSEITTLLEKDMSNIPLSLDAPRSEPAAAFSVKSRLGGGSGRPEYQTLAQACELIIYADQEHSVRQTQALHSQQNVTGDLMASAKANQTTAVSSRAAIHEKAQVDWSNYRQQTSAEVTRLLTSLPGAKP